jgi:hypothetical protein
MPALRSLLLFLAAVLPVTEVAMAEGQQSVRAFFTDELSVYMDVPPEVLWEEIKSMYVDADKFRRLGFAVEAVEDPVAYLGGTKISRIDEATGEADIRTAHFSAIDDEKRFLALRAVYSSGISAFASYQVRADGEGSNFQLIAHGQVPVTLPAGVAPTQASVRAAMAPVIAGHERALREVWAEETKRIEAMVKDR